MTHGAGSSPERDGQPSARTSPGMRYEFLVRGTLTAAAAAAFPELRTAPGPVGGTVLHGPVRDEADLHGLLARFAQLAIPVVEMRRLPDA